MAAGRPTGARNLTTREMKERAAHYGDTALLAIAKLMESEDERVVLDAAKTLLERGYGKAVQTTVLQGDEDGGPVMFDRVERVIVRSADIQLAITQEGAKDTDRGSV